MEVINEITLDLSGQPLMEPVKAKQGDVGSRFAKCYLQYQGAPYAIEPETAAKIVYTNAEGVSDIKDVEIDGDAVIVPLEKLMLAGAGYAHCDIQLYKDGKMLGTGTFRVDVKAWAADQETIEAAPEYQSFVVALADCKAAVDKADLAVVNAKAAVDTANKAVADLGDLIPRGEAATTAATNAAAAANTAADSANAAAQEATTAAEGANTAKAAAETAATAANEAAAAAGQVSSKLDAHTANTSDPHHTLAYITQGLQAGDLLKYNGTKLVKAVDGTDYITSETGTTNGWDWVKYSDGRAECYINTTYTGEVNKAWGSLYASEGFVGPNYPFAFSGTPCFLMVPKDSCLVYPAGNGNATSPGGLYILRPDKVDLTTRAWAYSITVFGRWK